MTAQNETVLFYTPEKTDTDRIFKGVFVRMGIRIRNVGPEQTGQKTGYLAGLPGFEEEEPGLADRQPEMTRKMLVFCGFTQARLNSVLAQMKKAKAPAVDLKAVLTEQNSGWSFQELYQELSREHEKMTERGE